MLIERYHVLQWHTSPKDVGTILSAVNPRLGVVTHLDIDDVSIVPIVSAIRASYQGNLALAKDLDAYEVSRLW